jgi:hypothetical protein
MKNLFSSDLKEQIDLVDFESLIGDLSLAIVIFPEAAGSFAETGYFSAIESLSSKIILVLDNNYQGNDSFIMLGPAKKIAENSYFTPNLQIDYRNPDFSHVVKRISRKKRLYKKELSIGKFSEISNFDLYCLIQYIVSVLKVANIGNILFLMRSIFGAHIEKKRVQKISSILFGAGYFVGIGEVGEFVPSDSFPIIANVKTGMKNERNALFEELTELYLNSGDDFVRKMGAK